MFVWGKQIDGLVIEYIFDAINNIWSEWKRNLCELVAIYRNMRQMYFYVIFRNTCFYIIRISAPAIFNQVTNDVDLLIKNWNSSYASGKLLNNFFPQLQTTLLNFRMTSAIPEYF